MRTEFKQVGKRSLFITTRAPWIVPSPPVAEDWVAIWRPRGDAFVRDADEEACRAWADREEIPARPRGRRVLLLGESVARGYFFDPAFTPARMLQAMLAPHVDGPVEVVDLAGNDLQPGGLLQLIATAPTRLHADAVVVFAGNNWYPGKMLQAISPAERAAAAATLAEEGAAGLARYLTDDFREEAARALGAVRARLDARVRHYWLLPEFNLGEWAAEDVVHPAWLRPSAAGVHRWWALLAEAEGRLEAGDLVAAEAAARRLVELDERSVPRSLGLLAACRERAGHPGEARELLEQARDARAWAHTTPRCRRVTKEAVRACAAPPLEVIDLADVFAMRLGYPIPSPDLFLDYCHLSVDGLRLAMATAARAVILGIGRGDPDLDDILDVDARPTREVEAAASFCAAIHNAHWGMAGEVVRRHLRRALALDPRMAETCERFLALQGARDLQDLAMGLEALPGAAPVLRRYLERYAVARYDEVLLDEMARALGGIGRDGRALLLGARREADLLRDGRVDLLSEFYAPRFRHPSWSDDTWAALSPLSTFPFFCDAPSDLWLAITCRAGSDSAAAATARVLVNARDVGSIPVGPRWQSRRLHVPAAQLREAATNHLTIVWPIADEGAALAEAAETLAREGRVPEPALALIHSLELTTA